jgi:hypothetical protein
MCNIENNLVFVYICLTETHDYYDRESAIGCDVPGAWSGVQELRQRAVERDVSIAVRSTQGVVRG